MTLAGAGKTTPAGVGGAEKVEEEGKAWKVEEIKLRLNVAERLTPPQSRPRPKPPESVTDTPPECPLARLSGPRSSTGDIVQKPFTLDPGVEHSCLPYCRY
jgi:hypothetical protein